VWPGGSPGPADQEDGEDFELFDEFDEGDAFDEEVAIPDEVLLQVEAIAREDEAFGPRFQARELLRVGGWVVPVDVPDGMFVFKVTFRHAKRGFHRTIAAHSRQTLEHLHRAIQGALEWDDDHLYSFFMNGVVWDAAYRFASPWEDDNPPWTSEAVLGELGLVKGHTFLYFFDYGDSHEFDVEVLEVQEKAEAGRYPRLVASKGDAPQQYWWGDEEEEWSDEEE
jgi:hypothetical protein